ncbi:MAG: radical SAM protein [Proteobacteria bacterium]|nr:radical SAM protein [Pseudomonadota bacterium]MBU1149538.1 radical SAM protein [Pseudomonadota bacterium]MBU2252687.1 radical SAM protein [Pseudomonadota bacterium]MBU4121157.1 radical SAM protein [Pseudomonadota bacterium]
MRVLLISANTERINILPLPLGLSYVAAATRNGGHDVRVLDLMAEDDSESLIGETIASFGPDVIGISVRNIDDQTKDGRFLLDEVRRVVRDCRRLSDAPVVLGGAGYSIFPESVLAYLEADMGIQGEGEVAFPALIERLAQQADLSETPGLYLRDRGLLGKRTFVKDLDSLPIFGAHEFLDSQDRGLWLPFQTRRGCPLNCSYCSTSTIEGLAIRKRSPEAAVTELACCVESGFRQIFFVDNTFNLPPGYAKEICRKIIDRGLDISWRCILYPGKVDEKLAALMAAAGCREVSLGFESGSERILRNMNKKFNLREIRQTAETLARHGIRQQGFLMLGGPGETQESVLESLTFADSLPLDELKITSGIRIYPQTALARVAIDAGMISPDDDLLLPKFYLVRELEEWLLETVKTWMADRPHWIT